MAFSPGRMGEAKDLAVECRRANARCTLQFNIGFDSLLAICGDG